MEFCGDGITDVFPRMFKILGSTAQVLQTISEEDIETVQVADTNAAHTDICTTTYHINARFCFCLSPTQELLSVKVVTQKAEVHKY